MIYFISSVLFNEIGVKALEVLAQSGLPDFSPVSERSVKEAEKLARIRSPLDASENGRTSQRPLRSCSRAILAERDQSRLDKMAGLVREPVRRSCRAS
jgi:hypothetical protein